MSDPAPSEIHEMQMKFVYEKYVMNSKYIYLPLAQNYYFERCILMKLVYEKNMFYEKLLEKKKIQSFQSGIKTF